MSQGLLVRLKPIGPWRYGSASGARNEMVELYHSDSLFSAVTHAMEKLGELDAWLEATAQASKPVVRFSSCYPWQAGELFVRPPRNLWPSSSPAAVRWRRARFVPTSVARLLLDGRPLVEAEWSVDALSGCLVPGAKPSAGPFRTTLRTGAAVDRLCRGSSEARRIAAVEFAPDAGLWLVVSFAGEGAADRWRQPIEAAFRLLADSGFGGRRSIGWGRSEAPEFVTGSIPALFLPDSPPSVETPAAATDRDASVVEDPVAPVPSVTGHWLLSLYRPAETEHVRWDRGSYRLVTRGGRIESSAQWGGLKRLVKMVAEGSVLIADSVPGGSVADVAPAGFPHPVYRYGFPVSVPIPVREVR